MKYPKIIYFLFFIIIIILFGILFHYFYLYKDVGDIIYTSPMDGHNYIIRSEELTNSSDNSTDLTDNSAEIAANFLATLKQKVDILTTYMKENKLPDVERANKLYYRWRKCKFGETKKSDKSVAYTKSKGEEMKICIRKNGHLEDLNTAIFVILHELAHIMSESWGHNDEFKENFSYIVHLASLIGIYTPQNFAKNPINYCGTEINTTPCSGNTCVVGSIKPIIK